jgi:hypothetical protein
MLSHRGRETKTVSGTHPRGCPGPAADCGACNPCLHRTILWHYRSTSLNLAHSIHTDAPAWGAMRPVLRLRPLLAARQAPQPSLEGPGARLPVHCDMYQTNAAHARRLHRPPRRHSPRPQSAVYRPSPARAGSLVQAPGVCACRRRASLLTGAAACGGGRGAAEPSLARPPHHVRSPLRPTSKRHGLRATPDAP